MDAIAGRPAVLHVRRRDDGRTARPSTSASGGHRLAPGFRMRGFMGGTEGRADDRRRSGSSAPARRRGPGAKLALDYAYVTGEYDYYDADATADRQARLEVDLDELAADLTYPIAEPVEGLIQPADAADHRASTTSC